MDTKVDAKGDRVRAVLLTNKQAEVLEGVLVDALADDPADMEVLGCLMRARAARAYDGERLTAYGQFCTLAAALEYISQNPGCTAGDVARATDYTEQGARGKLSRLKEGGWVVSRREPRRGITDYKRAWYLVEDAP